ncbi:MAG: multiheme c-type cytochrome [Kofleriaceae bacterium]
MPRAPVLVALVALATIAIAFGVATASKRDWTGTAACGACHPTQLASWQTTRHALTRDRFVAKPAAKCLACHGTGEAPAGPAIAVEVGCEACHGAGAAYAADDIMRNPPVARAMGLVDLSTPKARAALCAQCHARMTTSKPFDATARVH